MSKAGTIQSFTPFWQSSSTGSWQPPSNLDNTQPWTMTSQVTLHHPNGYDLESIDAQGIYSSAQYSEEIDVPVAVTANSKYSNSLFESFEDYDYLRYDAYCNENDELIVNSNYNPVDMSRYQRHWYLWPNFIRGQGETLDRGWVTETNAHSGKRALELNPGAKDMVVTVAKQEHKEGCNAPAYQPTEDDFVPGFLPEAGTYILTYWLKTDNPSDISVSLDYKEQFITLDELDGDITVEGWKKVTREFTLSEDVDEDPLRIVLYNRTGNPVYIDDLRIFPKTANMKSFVYDRQNLKVMAELDENNFATFYEYDDQGALVRVKKETERGIMSVQESRNNLRSNPNEQ